MDLIAKRKHPLAKCETCPLEQIGRFVPSDGPDKAKIACVGEAPGAQEARSGKPFTGPSGKLLETVLTHHGIKREEVFLTNACLCRPPGNDTPPKMAIEACRDRLITELQTRRVEQVIALGNSAAESLLSKSGITKLRVGPGKESSYLPGVRVIPTIHPAAALRQADFFPHIVTDIGKAVTPSVVWTEPKYVVAYTELDALKLLGEVRKRLNEARKNASSSGNAISKDFLVVDIEVDIEKDTSFDHPNKYGMLCVGLGYARGKALVIAEGPMGSGKVRSVLRQLLRSYRIVAQNGKFDLAGLYPILGGLELWYDSMLASYVFDERPGIHGLKYQAVEYLGAPQYDNEIRRYVGPGVGYGAIPRAKLYKYNATDVVATYERTLQQLDRFATLPEGAELRKVHDFLVAASNELMYVELNGITVDKVYLSTLESKFLGSLGVIEEEIKDVVGKSPQGLTYDKKLGFNPRSPQQVKKFLGDKGVTVDSTDVDTLNVIIERLSNPKYSSFSETEQVLAFCRVLLKHRKEAKLYGTYVKGIRKRLYRGRVYPTFMLHGTTTGRLSCRNPNLQNIPRGSAIRQLFVPSKPENVFVQTDYAQAELRVLSFLARDKYFQGIFNEGIRDLFDDLTPIVFPSSSGGKESMDPAAWKELRVRVKAFVYGLAYGRTAEGLAAEYDFSIQEARIARNNFFEVIPEIVEFLQEVRTKVKIGEDLVTPWGRHRRFMLITKENVQDIMNQAQAFLPQSTASDMCLKAMVQTRQDLIGFGYVRNIVHDSILVECNEKDAERVKAIMERNMLASGAHIVGDYVKMVVETKIGTNWGEV